MSSGPPREGAAARPSSPWSLALLALVAAGALAAAGGGSRGAVAPEALLPGDRARGDLSGDPADEDLVPLLCAEGRTVTLRLRGCGPGTGPPSVRLLRPDGSEEPLALEERGSRLEASHAVDEAGTWGLVVAPGAGGRRDWRLRFEDDGPRPADPAAYDLRDLVAWRGDVAPLLSGQCVRCHSGAFAEAGVRLDSYAAAAGESDRILFQVENGRMPPNRALAPSQVDRIRAWVAAGLPRR